MSHVNFSSLPPEQEASFVVFEEKMEQSEKKGFTAALIAAAAVFVIAMGVYLGVEPDKRDVTKGMNMSNLTKKSEAAAPAAAPAAPAPAEAAPAEAPPAEK